MVGQVSTVHKISMNAKKMARLFVTHMANVATQMGVIIARVIQDGAGYIVGKTSMNVRQHRTFVAHMDIARTQMDPFAVYATTVGSENCV